MVVFSFRFAARTSGAFFALFSIALLLYSPTWVEHYIAAQDQWPIATQTFRLVGASDLMVGMILLALAASPMPARSRCWVAGCMAASTAVLTAVHIHILLPTAGPRLWQPTLRLDTALFGLLAVYWVIVALTATRETRTDGPAV
jgi:hypothetical protein